MFAVMNVPDWNEPSEDDDALFCSHVGLSMLFIEKAPTGASKGGKEAGGGSVGLCDS